MTDQTTPTRDAEYALQIGGRKYGLDRSHSSVGFEIQRMGSTFRGSFDEFSAAWEVIDDQLRLVGAATVASVNVTEPELAIHLRSPDFFDEGSHPEITFASQSVAISVDGTLQVAGELTIAGITRQVHAQGSIFFVDSDQLGLPHIGLDLTALVDRNDFGLAWVMKLPDGRSALGATVTLKVALQFVGAVA
jgi:polyisoprenoid-binding protein YceI